MGKLEAREQCPTCEGRGRWLILSEETDEHGVQMSYYTSQLCGDCKGTGRNLDYEHDPENYFDIAGEGLEDDD